MRPRHSGFLLVCFFSAFGCSRVSPSVPSEPAPSDLLDGPFGVVIFVNPVNCELSSTDAERLNALNAHPKISVHVVFTSLAPGDSITAQHAKEDLGLVVSTSNQALPDWAARAPFNRSIPLGVVIRAGRADVFISGQTMERTIDISLAALGAKDDTGKEWMLAFPRDQAIELAPDTLSGRETH